MSKMGWGGGVGGLTFWIASVDTFGAPGNVTSTTLMLSLLFYNRESSVKHNLQTQINAHLVETGINEIAADLGEVVCQSELV